jgi:uncharacterized GH25 family protein
MRKIRSYFVLMVFLSICLLFVKGVSAHTLWLNASDYSPKFSLKYKAATKIYFGYGHSYPVDDFLSLDELQEFYSVNSENNKQELKPNQGGFLATQVEFKRADIYRIGAIKKSGFYTMYIEKGEIHHKLAPKIGLKNVIKSFHYEQYAKSLINVGSIEGDSFLKPIGHKLEIVPLNNPANLKGNGGDFLSIKVLFKGKPAKFCKVYATYNGFSSGEDFAFSTATNGEGIAKIRLIHWGTWLIKAKLQLSPGDDLKNKCDKLNYTATLTFEVP